MAETGSRTKNEYSKTIENKEHSHSKKKYSAIFTQADYATP